MIEQSAILECQIRKKAARLPDLCSTSVDFRFRNPLVRNLRKKPKGGSETGKNIDYRQGTMI